MLLTSKMIITKEVITMKQAATSPSVTSDFNYGKVFAIERKNDFSVIMKIIIASSFIIAIAVLIF